MVVLLCFFLASRLTIVSLDFVAKKSKSYSLTLIEERLKDCEQYYLSDNKYYCPIIETEVSDTSLLELPHPNEETCKCDILHASPCSLDLS